MLELAEEYKQLQETPEEHYRMPDAFIDEQRQKLDRAKKESVLCRAARRIPHIHIYSHTHGSRATRIHTQTRARCLMVK